MKFKIKGSWMAACGKGSEDTVVEVEQVLGFMPNGVDRMYEVRMPDGSTWTVSDWRGSVVEEPAPAKAARRARARLAFQPQCGSFVERGTGRRVTGVMLVKNVPDPKGQWWVGGEQVAIVAWADGSEDRQTKLYSLVLRVVKANLPESVLAALLMSPEVRVVWQS